MPKIIIKGFRCPYCLHDYKTEGEAEECANECKRVEEVIDITLVCCSMCGEDYVDEILAEGCEEHHKDSNDKYYQAWLVIQNFETLKTAANRPGQRRLT